MAFASEVDPRRAPRPVTSAERFAFSHAYATLVGVDCQGRVYPRLAASWSAEGDGAARRWTITLGDSARFWSGARVTAADVVAAWRATGGRAGGDGLAASAAAAATVRDDRKLVVALPDSTPAVFADPSLAVYRASAGAAIPEGTGGYRLLPSGTGPSSLQLQPVSDSGPLVVVRSVTGERDALDAGVDALVTADPAVAAYARGRAGLAVMPLPWGRVYAVFSGRDAAGDSASELPDDTGARDGMALAALARDAVSHADARGAEPPFWWDAAHACPSPARADAGRPPAARSKRVVFSRDDAVARALAERLVALAGMGARAGADGGVVRLVPALRHAGERASAVGLAPDDFSTALRAGNELAYVAALPRQPLSPCRERDRLTGTAPRIVGIGGGPVALIETRELLVVRQDRAGFVVDWGGGLRVRGPGPTSSAVR